MSPLAEKALIALFGSIKSPVYLYQCIGDQWEIAIHTLYQSGYVVIWFPDDDTRTMYDLTKKGNDYYHSLMNMTELPFTD